MPTAPLQVEISFKDGTKRSMEAIAMTLDALALDITEPDGTHTAFPADELARWETRGDQ